MKRLSPPTIIATILLSAGIVSLGGAAAEERLQGGAVDVSTEFKSPASVYFVANELTDFDPETGQGNLRWARYSRNYALSFNKVDVNLARAGSNEFPDTEYDRDPELPFEVTFISDRTVRLRFASRQLPLGDGDSLMLAAEPATSDSWAVEQTDEAVIYRSDHGGVRINKKPWSIVLTDEKGKVLTRTLGISEPTTYSNPTPFSFVRRARDLGRSFAAAWELAHDEMLFGCGESFTRFNKRGQKVHAYTQDGMGVQSGRMYKPVPFFLSSRGYGVFTHTSTPVTFDFGSDFDQSNVIYAGDETLDLFIFLGSPKEILTEYTAVTGRSPTPPIWSFGLWMSRITYKAEAEVRAVASKLRELKIPCDVIHLDTGWFEVDWQCDYKFAESRFPTPERMIQDLRKKGFRICLWQLPYFTTKNRLFQEALNLGLFVKNQGGQVPAEDGVLDFSNPKTVEWYQDKLRGLLEMGVAAIKVDFGEDAPLEGLYASGRTGWYEHNLYPLRYNRLVSDLTESVTSERIIWARSAWAGSQRYPLHWGGDAENTDSAMAATLRAGMSLGLCGFSFWSHDAGGFVEKAPRDLYGRWFAFSALTSHTRCHGAPPREPWEYDEQFVDQFRRTIGMKYRLLPYIYTQSVICSERGHPLLRPLFFEFPEDKTSWSVDDQYLLGSDLLVAPLFSESEERDVYLPPGEWIDYQSGAAYEGNGWHRIAAAGVPIVLLVRGGTVLPHIALAQSTDDLDWQSLELRVFGELPQPCTCRVVLPSGQDLSVQVKREESGQLSVVGDATAGGIDWRVIRAQPAAQP